MLDSQSILPILPETRINDELRILLVLVNETA
jgi:hypothetical protein